MSRATLICLVLLASVVTPTVTGEGEDQRFAPSVVVAGEVSGLTTVISWLPGAEVADSYRVYGINGGPVLLGEVVPGESTTDWLSTFVPTGFSSYAVSGVQDGQESPLVLAIYGSGETDCIVIEPPAVAISCIPIIGWPLPAKVRAMAHVLV